MPTSSQNPEIPDPSPLREDEFLTFAQLMKRLPPTTTRDAIRSLYPRGLRRYKIGKTTFFLVRELIAASAMGDDPKADPDDDQEE